MLLLLLSILLLLVLHLKMHCKVPKDRIICRILTSKSNVFFRIFAVSVWREWNLSGYFLFFSLMRSKRGPVSISDCHCDVSLFSHGGDWECPVASVTFKQASERNEEIPREFNHRIQRRSLQLSTSLNFRIFDRPALTSIYSFASQLIWSFVEVGRTRCLV